MTINVDIYNHQNDFYNYKMSWSFTDLCPGCLRFSIFIFSVTAGLLETKLCTCEAPVGWRNESLVMGFGSNDQDIHI